MEVNVYAAAISALWLALTGLAAGVIRWLAASLKEERAACRSDLQQADTDCAVQVAALEKKLDDAGDVIRRQTESLQQQIAAQQSMMEQQRVMIETLQKAIAERPA